MSTQEERSDIGAQLAAREQDIADLRQSNAMMFEQLQAMNQKLGILMGNSRQEIAVETPLAGGSFEDAKRFFIRLKPYDPRRGYVALRRSIKLHNVLTPEGKPIEFIIEGGTGSMGDVPIWKEVPKEAAQVLAAYKQDDYEPYSPDLFDICTDREMQSIDRAENTMRMSGLAKAGASPVEIQAYEDDLQAKTRRSSAVHAQPAPLPATRQAPALLESANRYRMPTTPPPPPTAPRALPPELAGRAAALDGLDDVPMTAQDLQVAAEPPSGEKLSASSTAAEHMEVGQTPIRVPRATDGDLYGAAMDLVEANEPDMLNPTPARRMRPKR